MKLVKINGDITIDADKLQALVSEQYNGRFYTHIYLLGDKEFLIEGYEPDIRKLIEGNEETMISKACIDKAIAEITEYASIWTSYNMGMTKEQIAQNCMNDCKEQFLRILKKHVEA